MTEKLYYIDSHRREFDAAVLSCVPRDGQWAVTLDQTCFFPGGGGQQPDAGTLAGFPAQAVGETAGEILHLCAAPLPVGGTVHGTVDWVTRFARMQQHSGEHIVSGLAHSLWGCENVGFHMAPEGVTIDFDRELDETRLLTLEQRANEAVWADLPFRCWFPDAPTLAALPYRSKRELSGAVRLVEIEGIDRCACCAPHVSRSGEIGLIRITDAMRHRGGLRLTLQLGRGAWEDARAQGETGRALSALLSVPRDGLVPAVLRLRGAWEDARAALALAERERMERAAAQLAPTAGNICHFEPRAEADALRAFVNAAAEKCRVCAAFAGEEGAWTYVAGSRRVDLRALARELNAALDGRGGGSAAMIQGSCRAPRARIEEFFGLDSADK